MTTRYCIYRTFVPAGEFAGDPNVKLEIFEETGDYWDDGVKVDEVMCFLCDDCESDDCDERYPDLVAERLIGELGYTVPDKWTYLHNDGSYAYGYAEYVG